MKLLAAVGLLMMGFLGLAMTVCGLGFLPAADASWWWLPVGSIVVGVGLIVAAVKIQRRSRQ